MSAYYGLDKNTPKNVYVPDTTQNRIIAYTAEEPMNEDETEFERRGQPEPIPAVQRELDKGDWELGLPQNIEVDMGEFGDNGEAVDEHCGCEEPSGPSIHRVGAPGGPDLKNSPATSMGPAVDDVDGNRVVLFDVEDEPYPSEATMVGSTGGLSKESSNDNDDDDDYDDHDEERAAAAEEEHAGRFEKYGSSWKPRVSEAFGDFAGDDWLEIG